MRRARIGIVGDYDPGYISHRETGAALEDSGRRLGVRVEYEWVATDASRPEGPARSPPSTACGRRPARPTAASTAHLSASVSRASGACRFAAPEGASNILC